MKKSLKKEARQERGKRKGKESQTLPGEGYSQGRKRNYEHSRKEIRGDREGRQGTT